MLLPTIFLVAAVAVPWALGAGSSVAISASVRDKNGNPVEDAVVFVYEAAGEAVQPPRRPYVMDQIDKEFVPHVLPIMVGGKVRFPNKDDIHHHLYSFSPAKTFELPLYKGEPAEPMVFDKPGVVKVGCNIHDWMNGIILVLPNAYFAKTDAQGKASLSLPTPRATLAVFHERLKGSVDDTRKNIQLREVQGRSGAIDVAWRLELKPEQRKKRPAGLR